MKKLTKAELREKLENLYKKDIAEKIVEYLIETKTAYTSLTTEQKVELVKGLLTNKGAKDITTKEKEKSTEIIFYAQNEELQLKKPVRVVIDLIKEEDKLNESR